MNIDYVKQKAIYLARKHGAKIGVGIGLAGVYSSVFFAITETPKALKILEKEEERRFESGDPEDISYLEAAKLTWKCYPKTIIALTGSSAIIVASMVKSEKRSERLMYSVIGLRETLAEFKETTKETVSANKYKAINEKIAQKRLDESDIGCCEIVGLREGYLIEDERSGRFLRMTTEAIHKVADKMNDYFDPKWCQENGVAPVLYYELNDFWDRIGLSERSCGRGIGWEKEEPIDVWFEPGSAPNGEPCFVMYTNAYELGI